MPPLVIVLSVLQRKRLQRARRVRGMPPLGDALWRARDTERASATRSPLRYRGRAVRSSHRERRDIMASPVSARSEVRQLARYQVRPETLERCLAAIHEFVRYVRLNEPGTLTYEVWQEEEDPTRFVHRFVFRDAEAEQIHSESAEVKAFAAILYPACLAPVEFTDYREVTTNH